MAAPSVRRLRPAASWRPYPPPQARPLSLTPLRSPGTTSGTSRPPHRGAAGAAAPHPRPQPPPPDPSRPPPPPPRPHSGSRHGAPHVRRRAASPANRRPPSRRAPPRRPLLPADVFAPKGEFAWRGGLRPCPPWGGGRRVPASGGGLECKFRR